MNYRVLIDQKLEEFKHKCSDYTFGQTILAAVQAMKIQDFDKTKLLNISDQEFYEALSRAFKNEDPD